MDEPGKHYAKWNKSGTKGQIFYDSTYMKFTDKENSETESSIEVTMGRRKGGTRYRLMGTESLLKVMKKFWKRTYGNGCTSWI